MIIVIIILLVGAFFGIAILLATGVVASQSWAKKQAKAMLDKGEVDQSKVNRVLKILSATQANEGKRLYSKLADLAEASRRTMIEKSNCPIELDKSYCQYCYFWRDGKCDYDAIMREYRAAGGNEGGAPGPKGGNKKHD